MRILSDGIGGVVARWRAGVLGGGGRHLKQITFVLETLRTL